MTAQEKWRKVKSAPGLDRDYFVLIETGRRVGIGIDQQRAYMVREMGSSNPKPADILRAIKMYHTMKGLTDEQIVALGQTMLATLPMTQKRAREIIAEWEKRSGRKGL